MRSLSAPRPSVPIGQDNATFKNPRQVSTGIAHVLVGGTFVLRSGRFVAGVYPGQPIRSEVSPQQFKVLEKSLAQRVFEAATKSSSAPKRQKISVV